jgi:hypothetical protein
MYLRRYWDALCRCIVAIVPGRVQLELISDDGCYQWNAVIGFAEFASPEQECNLLGHAGCLELFNATFDGAARVFELTPLVELHDTETLPS